MLRYYQNNLPHIWIMYVLVFSHRLPYLDCKMSMNNYYYNRSVSNYSIRINDPYWRSYVCAINEFNLLNKYVCFLLLSLNLMSDSFTNSSYIWPSDIIILSPADSNNFYVLLKNLTMSTLITNKQFCNRVKAYNKDRSGHGLLSLNNLACKGSLYPVEFKEWHLQLYYISNNR